MVFLPSVMIWISAFLPHPVSLEIGGNEHRHHRIAPGNDGSHFIGILQRGHPMEKSGAIKAGKEAGGIIAPAFIHCHIGRVFQIVIGGIAEKEPQNDDRHHHDAAGGGIIPDGHDFLHADYPKLLKEKSEIIHHSTFFLVMPKAALTKNRAYSIRSPPSFRRRPVSVPERKRVLMEIR